MNNWEETMMTSINCIARGWHVLPLHGLKDGVCTCGNSSCHSVGKHPKNDNGVNGASIDIEDLVSWFESKDDVNIGVATGQVSNLLALDIDPRHGGDESLLALVQEYGMFPETIQVKTGGGGAHYYFRYPNGVQIPNSTSKLGAGLDVKSNGGYVVIPPSRHASGGVYAWDDSDILSDEQAEMPSWLVGLLTSQPKREGTSSGITLTVGSIIAEGGRNTWLTSRAGLMRKSGMDGDAILAALVALNRVNCKPPLEERKVAAIAASVSKYEIGYPCTDAGNADFFADRHTGKICFRFDIRRWFVFNPTIWREDDNGEVERLALASIRDHQHTAFNIQDPDLRKSTVNFLLGSENGYRLQSLLTIARSRPTLAKSGTEFDREPMLLSTPNGVINLKTGSFRDGLPEDYLTQKTGAEFDPSAKATRWTQFVDEIFHGDGDLIQFVQRAIGYSLTGLTREQVFFFCYGNGQNGKGVLFAILRALLKDYAKNTSFTTFTKERGKNGHEDDLMTLEGARLITASENKDKTVLADDVLKTLAGEDPITGSRKNERTKPSNLNSKFG